MYHIIAVDDEMKALERFERLVSKEPRISTIMSFTNPENAVEYCRKHKTDIAFLDIDMPKIQGLKLADMLREDSPFLDIVFVTAYDQYALDAFRVHAYDYLRNGYPLYCYLFTMVYNSNYFVFIIQFIYHILTIPF